MMKSDQEDGLVTRVVRIERQLTALSASVDERFDAVDKRFDAIDKRFDAVDQRFAAVDQRFAAVDQRFDAVEARFDEGLAEQRRYTEFAFERLSTEMRSGFDRLERKLDRFIDPQLQTNELVDRRLRALEGPGRA